MAGLSYVYRDGSRLTPYMLYQINRADADFYRAHGCRLLVTSGIRTNTEQTNIFLSKYRVQVFGNGPYGDVRWWKGRRYVRVVGGGTVAAPGSSNHEIQGSKAAVDLRDSGHDAGVASGGNARANWLRANAHKYGLVPEGYGFGEPWHYAVLNIFNNVPGSGSAAGGGASNESEEDDMTPEQANQLDQLYKATFKGGPSMQESGNSISASLAKIYNAVKPINRDGKQVVLRQEIADTKTIVAGLEAGIQALAVAKGADPQAILQAVQDGVENAMRKVTFTADVDG